MSTQEKVFMRAAAIAARYGIGTSTLRRWAREKKDMPRPLVLSARCTVYSVHDMDAWFAKQSQSLQ